MAALTLNEIEIPIADGEASVGLDEVGERGRALNTFYRLNRARAFRQWKLRTPPLGPSAARALRGLLVGIGDTWRFDGATLLSSRGQGQAVAATSRFRSDEWLAESTADEYWRPRLGSHCLAMEAATTNLLTANQGTGTDALGTTAGFEAATSGGASAGVTTLTSMAPAAGTAKQGSKVLRVQTDATNQQGVRTTATVVANARVYVGSVYLRATSGTPTVRVYLREGAANGAVKTVTLDTTWWKRVEVSKACGAGSSVYIVVENNSAAAQDWYQDALQLEDQNTLQYATTWQDPASGTVAASPALDYVLWPEYDGDLCVMCWAKAHNPSVTGDGIIVQVLWPGYAGLQINKAGGAPDVELAYGHSAAPHVSLPWATFTSQEWHHIAAVLRRRPASGEYPLELYVDGTQRGFSAAALLRATGPLDLQFNNWNGLLDDVVIMPFAPPSSWITTWYQLYGGAGATAWTGPTAKVVGDVVRPTKWNGKYYFCVAAGNTAASEPATWPAVGGTVVDGTVTWLGYRDALAFPALPRLHARGRLVAGDNESVAPVQVIAQIDEETYVQGVDGGAWTSDLRQLAFTLVDIGEVTP